jgi:melibiose permease
LKAKTKRNLIERGSFALGAIGKDLISNFVGMFYLFFLTAAIGLSPLILGFAFFFAKIWDGINDPIVGALVDNTRTRFGKYRPWLVFGSLVNGIIMILMFLDVGNEMVAKYVYYIAMYILWDMTFTMMDIPYWAMIPSLANSDKERNEISTIARIFTGVGTLIVVTFTPFFLESFFSNDSKEGYLISSAIFTSLYVVMMCIMAIFIRERYHVPSEKIKAKEIFPTLIKNDQLRSVLIFGILNFTAMVITSVIAPYLFTYVMGDFTLISLFSVILGAGYGGSMLLFPLLSKKIGRKKIFVFSSILSIVGYLLLFLSSSFIPESRVSLSIAALLTFSGFGLIAVNVTAMLADVVDYGELVIGNRTESLVYAMQSFTYKFASALAAMITGVGLRIAGLTERDPETDIDFVLSAEGGTVIRVVMFLVPVLFLLSGLFVYLKTYRLNGKYKEEILSKLNEKRRESMSDLSIQDKQFENTDLESSADNREFPDLRPLSIKILDFLDKINTKKRTPFLSPEVCFEYDIRYGDKILETGDVFYPKNQIPKGVILNIHGGGFLSGDKKGLREFCSRLSAFGYFVFSINYTLAPHKTHPEPIKATLLALDYLHENQNKYNIDMSNLYLTGDSAGAYIALYTAVSFYTPHIFEKYNLSSVVNGKGLKGIMLYCGIYDFESASKSLLNIIFRDIIRGYTGLSRKEYLHSEDKKFYSPINYISTSLPKVFIASSKSDPLRKQGTALIEELKKAGVDYSFFLAKKISSGHDFHLNTMSQDSLACLEKTREYLEEVIN